MAAKTAGTAKNLQNKRQLNYEILRIIAMLMIVCLHYLSKGGLLANPERADMTLTGYTVWFIEALCLVAVNVYVLISGYFGVDASDSMQDKDSFSFKGVVKRPLNIWKQVFFYSAFIGFGSIIIGVQQFDIYRVLCYCFPIVTEHYWFATSYVMLCLMMPFLNAGVKNLKEKELRYILFALLLIFSIAKTIIPMQLPRDNYGYDDIWFIILYLTGAYLRRHGAVFLKDSKSRLCSAAIYFASMVLVFASFIVIRVVYLKTGKLENMLHYGYSYNYLFCYTGAIGLFMAFSGKKVPAIIERFRKPIELLSGATFGVYLIHEHINIRSMWAKWVHGETLLHSSVAVFLLNMVVSVLCVYLVSTLIEIIRQKWSFTIFPALVLLVYPLRHAAVGVDLMDAGYALGNYHFFDALDEMWKLATYMANITGIMLSKLPFGGYWIGMNVYCGLMIGAVAAFVYLFLWKHYGQNRKIFSILLFVAEITALSLCWAPSVILYHYLGYLLMTAASILIFKALTVNKNKYYVIAGVVLGFCIAVRMPNITYMALILPVWCDCFWKRQSYAYKTGNKMEWFGECIKRTLLCIAGYVTGVIIPLSLICAHYGVMAYPRMITSLFGMTDHASDYKPTSMVTAMFGDYIRYSVWLLLFAVYMALGIICFRMAGRFIQNAVKKKVITVLKLFYVLGLLVLLRFCYGRGMFGIDYASDNAYFSMYKWVTVYLLIVTVLCIWCLLSRLMRKDFRLWAVLLLVIIFVTPLGSNNGLYPIINNLFLVMPVSMLLMAEMFRQSKKSINSFAIRTTVEFVLLCTAVQSLLFGIGFVFHDAGAQGSNERIQLKCGSAGDGLATTTEKKAGLAELDEFLYQNELNKKQVILYGQIPALGYLLDMEPAVSSAWTDLDSYSIDIFKEQLDRLGAETSELPVIILGRVYVEHLTDTDSLAYGKLMLIQSFIDENGYDECFKNEGYIVFTAH